VNRGVTNAGSVSTPFNEGSQNVALTATVTGGGVSVNEGTETFTVFSGTAPIAPPQTVNVVAGNATVPVFTIPAATPGGSYIIQAVYNGTINYLGYTDRSGRLTITPAVTVSTASNETTTYSTASQTIPLSATVISAGGTVNEGTETFRILSGSTVVGTPMQVNAAGGAASVKYALPAGTAAGTYTIQAVYGGTGNLVTSTDTAHALVINAAATTITAAGASALVHTVGETVTLTAAVRSPAGTVGAGMVTFTILNGTTVVGTPVPVGVAGGSASASYLLPAGTAPGTYAIRAV
jgi:hypothetical protein